jgi:hypothetical protein
VVDNVLTSQKLDALYGEPEVFIEVLQPRKTLEIDLSQERPINLY